MNIKQLIKLGDVVVFKDGLQYIYLICSDTGYSSDKSILLRDSGNYYGNGLENFNEELLNTRTGTQIVKIYRPIKQLTCIQRRSEFLINFKVKDFLKNSIRIFPEENFINISLYV